MEEEDAHSLLEFSLKKMVVNISLVPVSYVPYFYSILSDLELGWVCQLRLYKTSFNFQKAKCK
jgi:hypothetical protein